MWACKTCFLSMNQLTVCLCFYDTIVIYSSFYTWTTRGMHFSTYYIFVVICIYKSSIVYRMTTETPRFVHDAPDKNGQLRKRKTYGACEWLVYAAFNLATMLCTFSTYFLHFLIENRGKINKYLQTHTKLRPKKKWES